MTDQELKGMLQCALAGPGKTTLMAALLAALEAGLSCNIHAESEEGMSVETALRSAEHPESPINQQWPSRRT